MKQTWKIVLWCFVDLGPARILDARFWNKICQSDSTGLDRTPSHIYDTILYIYIYTYIVYNILSKSVYYISSWFWMLCASLCCLPDASLDVFAPIWLLWHGKKHLGGLPQGLLRLKLWEPWTHEPSQTLMPSCGSGFNISIIICLQFLRLSSLVPNKPLIPNHPSSTSGQVCDASKMEGSIAPAQIQESSRACFFFRVRVTSIGSHICQWGDT